MKIIIDTREPLDTALDIKPGMYIKEVIRRKLDIGDYGCEIEGQLLPIFFDRKSIGDLFGTLTSGIDRFKKEVERVKESKAMLYLAIEGTMEDVYKGYEFSEIFGSQIIRTIFMFKTKYGVEPVFCSTRDEMKYYILETFDSVRRHMIKEDLNVRSKT